MVAANTGQVKSIQKKPIQKSKKNKKTLAKREVNAYNKRAVEKSRKQTKRQEEQEEEKMKKTVDKVG